MTRTGAAAPGPGVLSIKPFRRLWIALSLSSLGDWLSILALTALASALTADSGFQRQAYAVGMVLVVKALPAVLLGPLAGAVADRFDRRLTMVVADVLRFGLLLSVPLVGQLNWLLAATFLAECWALFWLPAERAAVPALVPADRLDRATRLTTLTRYGSALVAAGLFSAVALVAELVFDGADKADLALYVNAAVFFVSAATVFSLTGLSGPTGVSAPSLLKQIAMGWRFAGRAPVLRGLGVGLAGAFTAAAAVVGVAKVYAETLHAGDASYGMVFGAAFLGLGFGVFLGPRMLGEFSRRRLFGLAVIGVGLTLIPLALIQNVVVLVFLTGLLGGWAGVAWGAGRSVIGGEIEDEAVRGHIAAFLESLVRVVALAGLAVAPLIAGVIGRHRFELPADGVYSFAGTNAVLLILAVPTLITGLVAYRRMDDNRGIPLRGELAAALRGEPYRAPEEPVAPVRNRNRGVFIAFEGGEGAGKTTQSRLAAIWLRDHGYEVVQTNEPGGTKIGMRLRAILLDRETTKLSDRAEALLYAADRADHVANVIQPALARGAVVVTDRFVDSSLAYQGYGRELPVEEIAEVNTWATAGLVPDLTILLDVPPDTGFGRFASPADRMESQPRDFHDRVHHGFRKLAESDPDRYLIVDATLSQAEISRQIQYRILEILPDPIPAGTEDATSTFPAITDA